MGLLAVTGCSAGNGNSSTMPTATLTLFTFKHTTPTPRPTLFFLRTPTLYATSMMPLPLLTLHQPSCYHTPMGGMWCLGLVQNTLLTPVESITLRVYLLNTEGIPLTDQTLQIAHSQISPKGASPYGILFESIPTESLGGVAVLTGGREVAWQVSPTLRADIVSREQRETLHRVRGRVTNVGRIDAHYVEVIVTLFDADRRVTGYRQWRPAPETVLSIGATVDFDLEVIALRTGTMEITVSAEARPG